MNKFEVGDMVWSYKYGYGEVVYADVTGIDVKFPEYSSDTMSFFNDNHLIHARERWTKEVEFAVACMVSFFIGIAVGSGLPWS